MTSLERFIPPGNMVMPDEAAHRVDSVWRYHKFQGYGRNLEAYGRPADLKGYLDRAQLVNYDQYRALMEGHQAHMWDWYTGVIIWKTQNPWSAMRGQMYDPWLDPNAGLYGLHHANRPIHIMCDPADGMLMVVNNTFRPLHDLMVQAWTINAAGKRDLAFQWFVEVGPAMVQKIDTIRRVFKQNFGAEGGFLELLLLDLHKQRVDRNLCWFPDSNGVFTGLQRMPAGARQGLCAKDRGEPGRGGRSEPGGKSARILPPRIDSSTRQPASGYCRSSTAITTCRSCRARRRA